MAKANGLHASELQTISRAVQRCSYFFLGDQTIREYCVLLIGWRNFGRSATPDGTVLLRKDSVARIRIDSEAEAHCYDYGGENAKSHDYD